MGLDGSTKGGVWMGCIGVVIIILGVSFPWALSLFWYMGWALVFWLLFCWNILGQGSFPGVWLCIVDWLFVNGKAFFSILPVPYCELVYIPFLCKWLLSGW